MLLLDCDKNNGIVSTAIGGTCCCNWLPLSSHHCVSMRDFLVKSNIFSRCFPLCPPIFLPYNLRTDSSPSSVSTITTITTSS